MSPTALDDYSDGYGDESDADDEYAQSAASLSLPGDYPTSPTESDLPPSNEQTPTHARASTGYQSFTDTIVQWTVDQCADYVAALGLEQYADAFMQEEINGEALIAMVHDDLKEMGIGSMGHRLTILGGVYDIKLEHNVDMQPDHYVPLSAEANAPDSHPTQDDIARIINQIKLRDERLLAAEEELRILKEDLNRVWDDSRRLREDVLPVIRMSKDKNQPLPTPEGASHHDPLPSPHATAHPVESKGSSGMSRKLSTKKLFLGRDNKMPSPTIHEPTSLDPSAAAKAASSQLSASMSSLGSQTSPRFSQQNSPTSPPYTAQYPRPMQRNEGGPPSSRYAAATDDPWASSHGRERSQPNSASRRGYAGPSGGTSSSSLDEAPQSQTQSSSRAQTSQQQQPNSASSNGSAAGASGGSGGGSGGGSSGAGGSGALEFIRSFRVSMDEPCHKVLPVALKKYHIQDDWRQYSLYIVYGSQERCLALDEKPLILFKQLANEGKKPMFMLRKHATPSVGFDHARANAGESSGGQHGSSGTSSNPSSAGGLGQGSQSGRVQSYAEPASLPGGVI